MSNIFETIKSFFVESDVKFEAIKERIIRAEFKGKNGVFDIIVEIRDDAQQVAFYSISSVNIPKDVILEVMSFITRANYGMGIGNFELDLDDGDLRYKTSFYVGEAQFAKEHIAPLVYISIDMMDKYFPGIKGIVDKQLTAIQAIELIEE